AGAQRSAQPRTFGDALFVEAVTEDVEPVGAAEVVAPVPVEIAELDLPRLRDDGASDEHPVQHLAVRKRNSVRRRETKVGEAVGEIVEKLGALRHRIPELSAEALKSGTPPAGHVLGCAVAIEKALFSTAEGGNPAGDAARPLRVTRERSMLCRREPQSRYGSR